MTIKIVYSIGQGDSIGEQLTKALDKRDENSLIKFNLVSYNEEHHKQRKDALQLKASCGARLLPFCAIYNDDKEIIKASAFHNILEKCKWNIRGVRGTIKVDGG